MLTHISTDDAFELGCGLDVPPEPGEYGGLPLEFVHDENEGKGRWEIYHTIVFRHGGGLYGFAYNEPATESQEGQDGIYEDDPVPVFPMASKQVMTTVYTKVKS